MPAGAVGFLIDQGLRNPLLINRSISHLWALGFGQFTAESILNSDWSLFLTILIANSPQTLLSVLYLSVNGLLTSMLLADEWSRFAHQRKTLRVTSPIGKQRSTYFLHLPYSYSIPLLSMFGCLHWLVSQSLFLARVDAYDDEGNMDSEESISTCGYSLIALLLVLILGSVITLLVFVISFRKYKPGMPFVGSRSAAISAACHPPADDIDASLKPVMWGTIQGETVDQNGEIVGHCTITSFPVKTPTKGQLYAGRCKRIE